MIAFSRGLLLASILFLFGFGCAALGQGHPADAALRQPVSHFEIENQTLFDGLSRLSSEPIPLRLAFEEILRQNESDARDRDVRFSVRLENNSVRGILDALCAADARYTWSLDESTINVYPRAVETEPSYLLNLHVAHIELKNIAGAYEALTPLARLIQAEQIGYRHLGPSVQYTSPWNATFEDLTVRQLINRIAAHLGPKGGWMFSGSKENRWFTFHNGSFARLGSSGRSLGTSPAGSHYVYVDDSFGVSNSVAFTVTPVISSISPPQGLARIGGAKTINGAGFGSNTLASGANIRVSNLSVRAGR